MKTISEECNHLKKRIIILRGKLDQKDELNVHLNDEFRLLNHEVSETEKLWSERTKDPTLQGLVNKNFKEALKKLQAKIDNLEKSID